MKAMIFAAGLGSRLGEKTKTIPKALVEINGHKLLEIIIQKMIYFGITDIVINVHHFADMIENFINTHNYKNINIQISDERNFLLETGGGLQKAANMFNGNENILVHNVDILSNIDFNLLEAEFMKSEADAMLCIKNRNSSRKLLFNADLQLCGWKDTVKEKHILIKNRMPEVYEYAFSGISIIKPDLPNKFNNTPPFSLTTAFLGIADKYSIVANTTDHDWLDIGKPETLNQAEMHFNNYYKKYLS